MNFLLLEKTVKFKYLRHFFKKANNSLALYLVLNQRKNLSLLKTKYNLMTMQVPNLFLNLLLDKKSKLKWKWLSILQGIIYLCVSFDYNFNILNLKSLVNSKKDFFILGGFYRNLFLSWESWKWFLDKMSLLRASSQKELRFASLSSFLFKVIYFLSFFILMNLLYVKLLFKQIENLEI
ncbi:hypothetical protein FNF28_10016 (mitochondrion) [Cafeteria roenbergensis]|uniref:Uncharacterized protein n=1 Tax=Cafeteria roenbergensis TaxID=33653 RepID=A0A5A8BXK3_CAFRO|nr:hypothetical protein FNF28_10016 [Cafeteria roenbergensis]